MQAMVWHSQQQQSKKMEQLFLFLLRSNSRFRKQKTGLPFQAEMPNKLSL